MNGTLLVGTDGSEGAGRAIDFALQQAKLTGEELVVAYVIEWSPFSFNTPRELEERHKRREEEIERAQTEVIEPLLESLQDAGVEVRGMVRHGNPASTLDDLARDLEARVIFVGRKGMSKLQAMLFGSVAGSLVQISDRPVTVVP